MNHCRSWCRRWFLSWHVPALVLVVAAALATFLVFTGRFLPRWLPDFVYFPAMARLYDPCITAKSAEEEASAYRTLVARLGVDELVRLHSQNFNQPMTAIALGRSGNKEALDLLRQQARSLVGTQVTDMTWSQPRGQALHGLIESKEVSVEELRDIYDGLEPKRRWPVVYFVIWQEKYRFKSIVVHYQQNHLTGDFDEETVGEIADKILDFLGKAAEPESGNAVLE